MRDDNGLTPLGKIVTIAIVLIVIGVSIAMIFGGTDIGSDIRGLMQNSNTDIEESGENLQIVEDEEENIS